jgi:hypothetical protein
VALVDEHMAGRISPDGDGLEGAPGGRVQHAEGPRMGHIAALDDDATGVSVHGEIDNDSIVRDGNEAEHARRQRVRVRHGLRGAGNEIEEERPPVIIRCRRMHNSLGPVVCPGRRRVLPLRCSRIVC